MNQKNLDKLINEALSVETEEAREAGALGYMTRALVQATMPHKKPKTNEFTRTNGNFTLSIIAPSNIGIPYGSIPRLLMAWITTEAVHTKNRELILGKNLSKFMEKLGVVPTGGRWGSIHRLRNQTKKLISSSISCNYENNSKWVMESVKIGFIYSLM